MSYLLRDATAVATIASIVTVSRSDEFNCPVSWFVLEYVWIFFSLFFFESEKKIPVKWLIYALTWYAEQSSWTLFFFFRKWQHSQQSCDCEWRWLTKIWLNCFANSQIGVFKPSYSCSQVQFMAFCIFNIAFILDNGQNFILMGSSTDFIEWKSYQETEIVFIGILYESIENNRFLRLSSPCTFCVTAWYFSN